MLVYLFNLPPSLCLLVIVILKWHFCIVYTACSSSTSDGHNGTQPYRWIIASPSPPPNVMHAVQYDVRVCDFEIQISLAWMKLSLFLFQCSLTLFNLFESTFITKIISILSQNFECTMQCTRYLGLPLDWNILILKINLKHALLCFYEEPFGLWPFHLWWVCVMWYVSIGNVCVYVY